MNKLRKFLTVKWCAMLSSLLAMLGFAACGDGKNDILGPDLYGQPYAKFKVEGAVLNEDGKGIENVKVYVREHYGDTAVTDQQGKFEFNSTDIFPMRDFWVMAKDTKDNYETDSVNITTNFEGGDGDWFSGSYATTHDFTLKKKSAETTDKNTTPEK